ncbi:hypothetical protein D3C71_1373500 [compost metagenome]
MAGQHRQVVVGAGAVAEVALAWACIVDSRMDARPWVRCLRRVQDLYVEGVAALTAGIGHRETMRACAQVIGWRELPITPGVSLG